MYIVDNDVIKEIDQRAEEEYGIPKLLLMENAAHAVLKHIQMTDYKSVVVLAGTGNNGGDGIAIARHLHNLNYQVHLFVVGNLKQLGELGAKNLDIAKKMKMKFENIHDVSGVNRLHKVMSRETLIVDALFGTGLNGRIEGIAESVIQEVNRLAPFIISVDIPSGVSGDNGKVEGVAIHASKTVALQVPKWGNIFFPGATYNGELVVEDISIPKVLIDDMKLPCRLVSEEMVRKIIPKRDPNSHKGHYGKGSIIAGSNGMTGAAILSSKSALRSGIGLLKLYIPESLNFIVTNSVPEAVTIPLTEMRKGVIGINQVNRIIDETENSDVIAVGPGCGNNAEMNEVVRRLLTDTSQPLVIDADGLNALSKNVDILLGKERDIILTPHMGEMSRLTGLAIEEIAENPIEVARNFAKTYNVIVVLKGARTIVALPNQKVFVNMSGNPGMATAGSGDVLTGIITSFIAQGLSVEDAAIAGVYIHGLSGDIMVLRKGEYGLIAGDIVEGVTKAIMKILE